MSDIEIKKAQYKDAKDIALLVGELLKEIMNRIDVKAFNFDLDETITRLEDFIETEKNFVFYAKINDSIIGFITIYQSYSLYAEGAFGTIAELYVKPEFRSCKIGKKLINTAKKFAKSKNWTRLEVTTPPLPQFDNTLSFYAKEGFEISGGRKMKISI